VRVTVCVGFLLVELMMKDLMTFGIALWFFVVLLGCAHAPDSTVGMSKHQEIAAPQTTGTPQEVAAAQTTGTPKEVAATQTAGQPEAEVSETFFDFGKVSDGNTYIHAFKIRNTGTGVLEIRKIIPG